MEIVAHHRGSGDQARRLREAVAAGANRIELDVLLLDDRLVVAHDARRARRPGVLTLEQALSILNGCDGGLLVDVKAAGAATRLGHALLAAGLGPRTIVSGSELKAVDTVARISAAARAWTLPTGRGAQPAVRAGWWGLATRAARRRVELAAIEAIRDGRCEAVSVDRRFVVDTLGAAVHAVGGRLLVWTVDEGAEARRLAQLGVDALVTNDPRGTRRALASP